MAAIRIESAKMTMDFDILCKIRNCSGEASWTVMKTMRIVDKYEA